LHARWIGSPSPSFQVVRRDAERVVLRLARRGEARLHLAADARLARGDGEEQHERPARLVAQLRDGLEQQVDALVVELVAAGEHQEDCVLERVGHDAPRQVGERLARVLAPHAAAQLVDHLEVDAVGQHRRGTAAEEALGLARRQLADGR
jgi:hypothetical protein